MRFHYFSMEEENENQNGNGNDNENGDEDKFRLVIDENKRVILSYRTANEPETEPETDCNICKGARGFKPAIPRAIQHTFFEENAKHFYANKEMASMKSIENLLKQLCDAHKTTKKAAYIAVKRYGVQHGHVTQTSNYKKEPEQPEFSAAQVDTKHIGDPEGTWILNVEKIDVFQGDFRRTGYVKGFHMTLREILWYRFKYPCNFDFHRVKLSNGEISSTGFCKNNACKTELAFHTEDKRKTLHLTIKGYDAEVEHTNSKAYITGEYKSQVLTMLREKTAVVVRSKLNNELSNNYDPACPLLPTEQNLRQIASRQNMEDANLRHENSAVAICMMKYEPRFFNCIASVGLSPFFVYYATPNQNAFASNELRRRHKIISVDATGIGIRPPQFSAVSDKTGNAKYVFLYQITLHGKERNMPIYQMLSQEHTSRKIADFISTWNSTQFRDVNPQEVIIDQSAALLLALVQSLTESRSVHD